MPEVGPLAAQEAEAAPQTIAETAQAFSDFWDRKDAEVGAAEPEAPAAPQEAAAGQPASEPSTAPETRSEPAQTASQRYLEQRAARLERELAAERAQRQAELDLVNEGKWLRENLSNPSRLLEKGGHTIQSLASSIVEGKWEPPKEKDKADLALEKLSALEKAENERKQAAEQAQLREQYRQKEAQALEYAGNLIKQNEEKYPMLYANQERIKHWLFATSKAQMDAGKPVSDDEALEMVNQHITDIIDNYEKYKQTKATKPTSVQTKPTKPKSVTISQNLVEPVTPVEQDLSEQDRVLDAVKFGKSIMRE